MPSMTKATTTPTTSTHGQYGESGGTIAAASASPTTIASFQNMVPPLRSLFRNLERIAVRRQHVDRGARLERFGAFYAGVPACPAIAHARQARPGVDPAFEVGRHAGVDRGHLL